MPETRKKLTCELCNFEFEDKQHLTNHKDGTHTKRILCNRCLYFTNNSEDMQSQTNQKHPVQLRCINCKYTAFNRNDLNKHTEAYHYKCDECSYTANHVKNLQRHKNTMHTPIVSCDKCDDKFRNNLDLRNHIASTHEENTPNNCYPSRINTKDRRESVNHIHNHHTQRTRIFSNSRFPPSYTNHPQENQIFRPWAPSMGTTGSSPSSHTSSRYPAPPRPCRSSSLNPNNA